MAETTTEQSYWKQAEKDVQDYFRLNNCEAIILTDKDSQYSDLDLAVTFPDAQQHTVSVKYMQAVAKYCNLSFEIYLHSNNGARMEGWFTKGKSTITAIIIPDVEIVIIKGKRKAQKLSNNKRILLFSTARLKEIITLKTESNPKGLAFKVTRLTDFQKQFNAGRKFNDAENLIVRLEDLLPYTLKQYIIK